MSGLPAQHSVIVVTLELCLLHSRCHVVFHCVSVTEVHVSILLMRFWVVCSFLSYFRKTFLQTCFCVSFGDHVLASLSGVRVGVGQLGRGVCAYPSVSKYRQTWVPKAVVSVCSATITLSVLVASRPRQHLVLSVFLFEPFWWVYNGIVTLWFEFALPDG